MSRGRGALEEREGIATKRRGGAVEGGVGEGQEKGGSKRQHESRSGKNKEGVGELPGGCTLAHVIKHWTGPATGEMVERGVWGLVLG